MVGTPQGASEGEVKVLFVGANSDDHDFVSKESDDLEAVAKSAGYLIVNFRNDTEEQRILDRSVIKRLRPYASKLLLLSKDREALMRWARDEHGMTEAQYFELHQGEKWKIQLLQFLQAHQLKSSSTGVLKDLAQIVRGGGELAGLLGAILMTATLIYRQMTGEHEVEAATPGDQTEAITLPGVESTPDGS